MGRARDAGEAKNVSQLDEGWKKRVEKELLLNVDRYLHNDKADPAQNPPDMGRMIPESAAAGTGGKRSLPSPAREVDSAQSERSVSRAASERSSTSLATDATRTTTATNVTAKVEDLERVINQERELRASLEEQLRRLEELQLQAKATPSRGRR